MSEKSINISRRGMLQTAAMLAGGAAFAMTAGKSLAQPEAQVQATEAAPSRDVLKDKRPILHANGSRFGAYDPHGDFRDEKGDVTEHLFLPWEDVDLSNLGTADDYAYERGRKLLITIEPWSWDQNWNVSSNLLRQRILSGYYDANMQAICDALSGFKCPITIRWAQEMDNPYGRFTWSLWPPADYIKAFRRMHAIVKKTLPEAKMMWSPRGEKGLQAYYPGDKFVDIVGLSVFGYEPFDKIEYGAPRSFAESVKRGYELSAGFGKPIWVAELGYEGGKDYLTKWVEEATRKYPEYPALEEVVYFNDKEVWPWPYGLGLPNWRVVRNAPMYAQRSQRG